MVKNKTYFLILLGLFITLVSPWSLSTAYASTWYSWYQQNGYYGLWATIYTPSSQPYTPANGGQSNSVTTPYSPPNTTEWVQAGWRFYPGMNQPEQYYEHGYSTDDSDIFIIGDQPWGVGIKYEVSNEGFPELNRWCAWVAGVQRDCWNDITPAPALLTSQSEMHNTSENVVFTSYKDIRVMNSSGTWVYPTLMNHRAADPPYGNTIMSSEAFLTWRYGIFLPIVIR